MKIKFYDLSKSNQLIKKQYLEKISQLIDNSNFIGGQSVTEFENLFAKYLNSKYCLGVGNGSDALEIILASLNLPAESEILLPVFGFISTPAAILKAGLKPVFCQTDTNLNLDPNHLVSKINSKTKAIIVIHLFGQPANLAPILNLCKKYNILLIEDVAHAHGAILNNNKIGSFGDFAIFSFYPNKLVGAFGDAGAIVTSTKKYYDLCRKIANHGIEINGKIIENGRNSRLDAIQAEVIKLKLNLLEKNIKHRSVQANIFFDLLNKNKYLILPKITPNSHPSWYLFNVIAENRFQLINFLNRNGVEARIYYNVPYIKIPIYKKYANFLDFKQEITLAKNVLCLPIGEHLSFSDIKFVAKKINQFYKIKK